MIEARTMPNDFLAEQEVLGACMLSPRLCEELTLSGPDFYAPAHETIWLTIRDLTGRGVAPTPTAVHARLQEQGKATVVGGAPYLHTLTASIPLPATAQWYAGIIRDRAGRRRLIEAATRVTQEAFESADSVEEIAARAELGIAAAVVPDADVDDLLTLDEFVNQPLPEEEWVIPKLLARGDRLVLTGLEGLGKSVLTRQLAVCAAAGIDPFTGRTVPLRKVLVVDCENPKRIMMHSFGVLHAAVKAHGAETGSRLLIKRRPEGMDLANAAERLWLQRLCRAMSPDMLCIGPAYKLHTGGGEREEDLARQVTSALDHLREDGGFAVVLEHHAPHAAPGVKQRSVRPFGSSLWLRWPEFGIGIRHADQPDAVSRRLVDVIHWRGPREERPWPEQLESGGEDMPWVEVLTHRGFP